MPQNRSKKKRSKSSKSSKNSKSSKSSKRCVNSKSKSKGNSKRCVKGISLVDEIAQNIEGKMFTKSAEPYSIISSYKIKNILDDKELYDKSLKLCTNKMVRKSQNNYDSSKNIDTNPEKLISNRKAENICKCLLRKNGEITLRELETLTLNKEPTPGSECLELL